MTKSYSGKTGDAMFQISSDSGFAIASSPLVLNEGGRHPHDKKQYCECRELFISSQKRAGTSGKYASEGEKTISDTDFPMGKQLQAVIPRLPQRTKLNTITDYGKEGLWDEGWTKLEAMPQGSRDVHKTCAYHRLALWLAM